MLLWVSLRKQGDSEMPMRTNDQRKPKNKAVLEEDKLEEGLEVKVREELPEAKTWLLLPMNSMISSLKKAFLGTDFKILQI